ncbi:MAG: hypothetical protein Q8S01_14135 [Ignavibacteria bacterium]|nr:hypothetical protein [Ignavibacteria bacterium]
MKKTLLLQFVFQLILACSIYSQINFEEANSTKIFIKPSEREIDSRVIAIASYGIVLENSETVSYRVISKIVTDNEKLLDTILTFVSNAAKSSAGNSFVLEMKDAVYEKHVASDNRVLQDQVFTINFLSSRAENIELAFGFSPRIITDIYFQMCYTNGRHFNKYAYSLSAMSAGIGRKFKLPSGEILLGINTGIKSLTVSTKKFLFPPLNSNEAEPVTYLEFLYRNELVDNWINFSVGSKYYLSNVSVLGDKTKFSISIGLALKLSEL